MTETQYMVSEMYKDAAGRPIILTPGQDFIFETIAKKRFLGDLISRLHIMCHTRYGKSMTVALAVLTRVAYYPEKWAIIAGTKDKAKIIMDYIIAHIFDNPETTKRFMPEKGETIEDIRRYRNKNRVTFRVREENGVPVYGEVFVGSAKDALGYGAQNVVEDESALINNDDHSLVMRMLGDSPQDNFLCKIGNPFTRGHFLDSYHDPKYKKIIIDCYKSLNESLKLNGGGRMTQDIIDENKTYSFFNILYGCKYPRAAEIDESGWMYLLTDEDIKRAVARQNETGGIRRLGVDVARGGRNYNAFVIRTNSLAKVLKKTLDNNLISVGDEVINIMRDQGIMQSDVFVDDAGVGGGVTDYLLSRGIRINPINFGESATKEKDQNGKELSTEYLNTRAQVYAGREGVSNWVKQGGQLVDHKDWIELTRIRYKKDNGGKIKIEPKEEMRKRGIESPDVADALALTFANVKIDIYYKVDPQKIMAGGIQPYPGMPG